MSTTVYNWVRLHRLLRLELEVPEGRRRFQLRTLAMAVGVTDRVWGVADILRYPLYP